MVQISRRTSSMGARKTRRRPDRDGRTRKTLLLDQSLIDEAREALGARTDSEAITQALEAIVRREAQIRGVRALATLGPFDASRID
jgi:hypothetical protein